MTPYETLGVQPDATDAQIRKAFRSLAQKHHPDKGGDHDTMQAVQAAHDCLSDPDRRKRFDETGLQDRPKPLRDRAMATLRDIILKCIDDTENLNTAPLLRLVRKYIQGEIRTGQAHLEKARKRSAKRQTALKRLKHLSNTEDLLCRLIQADIDSIEAGAQGIVDVMNVFEEAQAILVDYEYQVDRPVEPTTTTAQISWGDIFKM